ncbi:MAG: hemerythrin family protein [Sedimenticola sp.]|nr:hemerythrin family protein [Sedimenticola sp.]MCW8976901.1 hemerythrin family protein [Sedimenticola sp.]
MHHSEKSTIDGEHAIQIGMINLLGQAIAEKQSITDKTNILDQLINYTEVHFMSEQLIMRQHSYEGYNEHNVEHDNLMEQLLIMKDRVLSKETSVGSQLLNELRDLLITHIATQDRKLTNYLLSARGN